MTNPNAFRKFGNVVPKGQDENSPEFQRRDQGNRRTSPEGTAEIMRILNRIQPSLRDCDGPLKS